MVSLAKPLERIKLKKSDAVPPGNLMEYTDVPFKMADAVRLTVAAGVFVSAWSVTDSERLMMATVNSKRIVNGCDFVFIVLSGGRRIQPLPFTIKRLSRASALKLFSPSLSHSSGRIG